jgi:16S rRNA (cytidine1402-2'-O)-methyltransferase
LVLFEAPSRTVATLEAIAEVMPDRQVCLCRELTKLHEEIKLASAAELAQMLSERDRVRGEVALVVGPGLPPKEESTTVEADAASLKSIATVLAERWGVKKRTAYQALLKLEAELGQE